MAYTMYDNEPQCYSDGFSTIVAFSSEDARDICCEFLGEVPEDYSIDDWSLIDDQAHISIWCDQEGKIDEPSTPGCETIRLTAKTWARREGRGFLCTSEY